MNASPGTAVRSPLFTLCLASLLMTPPVFCQADEAQSKPAASADEVYQSVPPEGSLQADSRFIVVDDFNRGKLEEASSPAWRVQSPVVGALDLDIDKEDSRNPTRGRSLKGTFHLMPGEKVSWLKTLNRIDVSAADLLVFRYKFQAAKGKDFAGKFFVSLTDGKYRTVTDDITGMVNFSSEGWKNIAIPMKAFESLDLNQFLSVRFTIAAGERAWTGSLWMDEIVFYGSKNLGFESHRDNLVGFPGVLSDEPARSKLLRMKNNKDFLKQIARDTWKYFENGRDRHTDLIADHLRLGQAPLAADYTSPTNIAMDLLSNVSAMELGFVSRDNAGKRAKKVMSVLESMKRYKGFFYNFYHVRTLAVTRNYISTVDNGWLAIALVVTRQAFGSEVGKQATKILDAMSFGEFLDTENYQLVVGFEVPVKDFGKSHYGIFATEARATSMVAIGKGDIPREHWWYLYRTPPAAWTWQNQKPMGANVSHGGVDYFQGYYESQGKKFVPSWGGSLFEFLMPTLVLKEREFGTKGLGLNDRIAAELQRDYALKQKKYPVWGISSAAISDGKGWRYVELGVKELAVKGYRDMGVITPHVSFLALDALPQDAISNIRRILDYPIYGEYGLYDSVDVRKGTVNPQYLALDQGMTLVAICNYLRKGFIQNLYHKDPVGKVAEDLLRKESFFNR